MQVQCQPAQTAATIDLMVSMGPQHPSTDGVFGLALYEGFEGYPGRKSFQFHDYQE